MRLRIWSALAATCAILLAGAWWLHGTSNPTAATAPARGSRTSKLAEMIRRLPTPKQLALRPVFVAPGELRLEGQTVDADKHPIAGVTVTLNTSRTTVSETDGSFAFDHLAAADYTLIAATGIWYGEDTLTLSDTSDPLELEMTAGPTVALHVVDPTHAPVRDAEIRLSRRQAVTDADGNATLRGLGIGEDRIAIEAAGYGPIRVPISLGDDRHATIAKTVVLQPGSELAGVVVDEANHPVPKASVQIRQGEWRDRADGDDQGRFSFPYVGPGKVTLSASSEAYVETPDLLVEHDGIRANRTVMIHVELGARATGIVVDEHGAPVAKASVNLGSSYADSDDTGHFALQGIAPGKQDFSATTPLAASQKRQVEVAKGAKLDLRIVVLEGSIAGVVRDPQGAPVEGAMVNATGENAIGGGITRSDERGAFDFGGLPPGRYDVAVQRDGDRAPFPAGVMVQTAKRDLVLVVPELGGITGHVVLDGAPVTYFGVGARLATDTDHDIDADPVRENDGTFTVDHLAPGVYSLGIVGSTFDRKVVSSIVVRAGEVANAGQIEVTRGRVVKGHVRAGDGQPIANVMVSAASSTFYLEDVTMFAQREGARHTTTAGDGSFELGGIAGDDLWIEATRGGDVVRQKLADGDADVELVLAATGAVAGRVIHARHEHWTTLRLSNVADTLDSYSGELDVDDGFHFDHVPPGDYVIELSTGATLAPVRVHVDADTTTSTTIELPAEPVKLVIDDPGCTDITLRTRTTAYITSENCVAGAASFADVVDGTYLACRDFHACGEVTVRASPPLQEVTLQIQTPQDPPTPDPEPSDPPATEDEGATSEAP